MNKPYIAAILAITSLSFSAGAIAQDMSKSEYKAAGKNIKVDYKSAKANCASFAGNAKDICLTQAKGDEKVAKAELEARYMPSIKSDYKISVAEAEEHYAVSKEKCDDKTGKLLIPVPQDLDKFVCIKEAKAARRGAKSDAKAQLKIAKANTTTNEESSAARIKAKEEGGDARQDAAADKRDAGYDDIRGIADRLAN
ncbi:MAG: hypothetical protein Q8O64_03070 [Sideroxyarcus sp.]|nr:hypothetical protein [Sideroxyarcus sp.]